MFHHLFFVMTLSGSSVVFLYGLTCPIAQRYFPYSWRKSILTISLFFYLVPISLLKQLKKTVWSLLKLKPPPVYGNYRIDPTYTINIQNNQLIPGSGVVMIYATSFCIAVIAFAVILKQFMRYSAVCRTYSLKSFQEAPSPQLEKTLRQTEKELHIKKSVKLTCSRLCNSPVTIGVFKPVIVFPPLDKMNLCSDDNKYILKHELLHIKNRDLLLKFLALLAIALHWYNPICYFLYYELCVVSEINCDYGVLKGADEVQRQRYSHLILDLAVAGGSKKERFAVGLANHNAAAFERRIREIKKTGKPIQPVLSSVAMALICITGTISAFTYEAPQKYVSDNFDWESEYTFSKSVIVEYVEQLAFDYFFTDNKGCITPLDNPTPNLSCVHDYVEGRTTYHAKESNGECTVTVRNARKCVNCDSIAARGVFSESKYAVCPH